MEANRAKKLRRVDYLLRQLHLEALRRREEFTEVIYRRTHVRIPHAALRVIDQLQARPTRVSDLATELHESLPTIGRLVQQLEAKGLVERTRDEADARASIVGLSPLGIELYHTMQTVRLEHVTLCTDGWTDEQLDEMLPFLERLTADNARHRLFTEPWNESFKDELAEPVENI